MDNPDENKHNRQRLLREIETEMRELAGTFGTAPLDVRVAAALTKVRREEFVPSQSRDLAYANCPLPIGHGQTISQPFIVAFMSNLLQVDATAVVLEVGTGSGYQAAVLAELARRVYTIEVIEDLALQARHRLSRLGYTNVEMRCADGYHGWPEHAPFDGIMVTAAANEIPPPLVEQLRPGARLVAPVDHWYSGQDLVLLNKDASGRITKQKVLPVAFVPLTRH